MRVREIFVASSGSIYHRNDAIQTDAKSNDGIAMSHVRMVFFIILWCNNLNKYYFVSLTAVPEILIINMDPLPIAS